MSASGSFKTQVKPAFKNRFQVFVSIRSKCFFLRGAMGRPEREPGNNKLNLHIIKASTPAPEPWPHALVEGECSRHFIALNFLGCAKAAETRNQDCETESWRKFMGFSLTWISLGNDNYSPGFRWPRSPKSSYLFYYNAHYSSLIKVSDKAFWCSKPRERTYLDSTNTYE